MSADVAADNAVHAEGEVGTQGEEEGGRRRGRKKVVKPWFTKAQETVDYSNVEAM